jgi:hypothetical protein
MQGSAAEIKVNPDVRKAYPGALVRHCEERSDEAIHPAPCSVLIWIASLRSQ